MAVRFHERIAIRLSQSIVIIVLVTAVTVATLVLRDEERILQQDLRLWALQLGEIMSRQVLEPLLYEEDYTLHELITSYLPARDVFLVKVSWDTILSAGPGLSKSSYIVLMEMPFGNDLKGKLLTCTGKNLTS